MTEGIKYKYNGKCKYCGYEHSYFKNMCIACGMKKHLWVRILSYLGIINFPSELPKDF